jgi:preprotein translocase subunit SecE
LAKAVRTARTATVPSRPTLQRPRANRPGLVEYFRGVWDELKKVVWPGREELLRMTGIVLATVILFAVLIGAADYLLSLGVKQLYTSSSSSNTTTTTPVTPTQQPITTPATAVPSAAASPHATPVP